MNYYISDLHFGHYNIVRLDESNGCKSFSSIEEHDNLIIENWNKVVTPQDNVYVFGDSVEADLAPALHLGMNAFYVDNAININSLVNKVIEYDI